MDAFWTVCRTHANCEKIAIRNLENQSYAYYWPRILERRLVSRKGYVLTETPLFPCYLFVRIDGKWSTLRNTYGINSVVSMDGLMPAKVADAVIESLRSRQDERGFIVLPKAPKRFTNGDKVKITKGPLANNLALIERMPAKERQKVLLALLSNKISVLVDERDLVPGD